MLLGLRSLIHPVTDVEAPKRWFADVLGVEPYFDEPFYVGFDIGGHELGLWRQPDAGPAQAYWGVDDLATTMARMEAAGATRDAEPSDVGGGILMVVSTTPTGEQIGLIQHPDHS